MGSDMIIAAEQGGSGAFNLLLLLAVPLVFYFLLIRPQSKRRKEQLQLQGSLQPGARVVTTSGMYADVVSVDDDGIELEIAPGVTARFVKQAVMNVVGQEDDGEDGDEELDLTEDGDEDLTDDETASKSEGKADLKKAGTPRGGDEEDDPAGATAAGGDEDGTPAAQGAGAGKGLKKSSD